MYVCTVDWKRLRWGGTVRMIVRVVRIATWNIQPYHSNGWSFCFSSHPKTNHQRDLSSSTMYRHRDDAQNLARRIREIVALSIHSLIFSNSHLAQFIERCVSVVEMKESTIQNNEWIIRDEWIDFFGASDLQHRGSRQFCWDGFKTETHHNKSLSAQPQHHKSKDFVSLYTNLWIVQSKNKSASEDFRHR